jgi:hypothetical protein
MRWFAPHLRGQVIEYGADGANGLGSAGLSNTLVSAKPKHGAYSAETIQLMREIRELQRAAKRTIDETLGKECATDDRCAVGSSHLPAALVT